MSNRSSHGAYKKPERAGQVKAPADPERETPG